MPMFSRRPSRPANKQKAPTPPPILPTRAGLSVDTNVSRHHGAVPEQVFPKQPQVQTARFINLGDVRSMKDATAGNTQLQGNTYIPPSQQKATKPPLLHNRIKGLRPAPLELNSDVSPSDRTIPIGLELPSSSLSKQLHRPTNLTVNSRAEPSLGSGKELATPTIVITPAEEEFGISFSASPEETRHGRRPTSSIYSTYPDGTHRNETTPPVPPLPFFATEINASLRADGTNAKKLESTNQTKKPLSLRTVFEDDRPIVPGPSYSAGSRRLTSASSVSTQSKGWWNVITSPFATSIKSPYLRSPPDGELRSAPDSFASAESRSQPKRSDTAPGALDMGDSDVVNIYRRPSRGAALSYYNAKATKGFEANRSLAEAGWSPSQSCYRQSRGIEQDLAVGNMRESQFYAIPGSGEAAEYYNPNRRFPSLAPYGAGAGERGLPFDPRDSVAQPATDDASCDRSAQSSAASSIKGDGDRLSSADNSPMPPTKPPYPETLSPFDDSNVANFEDIDQAKCRGYGTEHTPKSGDVGAFKGFSATFPPAEAAPYPESPDSRDEYRILDGGDAQRHGSDDMFSPLLETPSVEEARTATFTAPEHREVEIRQPLPVAPPAYRAGLGNATMSTATAPQTNDDLYLGRTQTSMPQWAEAEYARSEKATSDYSEDEFNNQERGFSEKESTPERAKMKRSGGCSTFFRRFRCLIIPLILLLVTTAVILLLVFMPWNHKTAPVQAQWLNLTGFPPLPTGVATVINPTAVKEVSGCVRPENLWSCAMPPNEGQPTATQPSFRFQIQFRDNILPSNETAIAPSNNTIVRRSLSPASSASQPVRRSIFSAIRWQSSPPPPSLQDQTFLGRTTDNNTIPYDGEETPFYISLLNASALTPTNHAGLHKRTFHYPYPSAFASASASASASSSTPTGTTFAYPGASTPPNSSSTASPASIPYAPTLPNGLPTPAQLYPLPALQPLRLYDRGLPSEHYAFYTYYARTLYLSGNTTSNTLLASSTAVCTWSQTRFLLRIWTRKRPVASLSATTSSNIALLSSSANDMQSPGSFPYAVTVTLDRHGGDAGEKGVYCYSLDAEKKVLENVREWVVEDRGFGGTLVGAAGVPTNDGVVGGSERREEGIDGGTGGCGCEWQNW